MRPNILHPLFADIRTIPRVGEKTASNLSKLLGFSESKESARLVDLLFHLPRTIIDRRYRPNIADAQSDAIATLEVRIVSHKPPSSGSRTPHKVKVEDDTGELTLSFFKARGNWIEQQLPIGETRYISGKVELYRGDKTMVHPDYIVTQDKLSDMPSVEPVYALGSGVTQKIMLKSIKHALDHLPDLPEWHDESIIKKENWLSFKATLERLHSPHNESDILPESLYRRRLSYDELLSGQLAFGLVRRKMKRASGNRWSGDSSKTKILEQHLPFTLTQSQQRSIDEINTDLSSETRMMRLLQGDVGSGKTIVALFGACRVIESGAQVAFMAPTEILARQHHETISVYAEATGLRIAILTGRDKGKTRKDILDKLLLGELDLLIGTHTLFQQGVSFKNLGLAIVDEQHRFGVHQRLALASKGKADILLMTATPIPRTLVLTHYGNMEVSKLDEYPAGRGKITTHALPTSKIDSLLSRVDSAVKNGEKVYWVCPLVEDSEKLSMMSVKSRFSSLQKLLGDSVGLLHGSLKSQEKDSIMSDFKSGKFRVLVSTTVIEVGVDVSDVKIMVIEHAERFGLSQLHQLRGRIGRDQNDGESHCLLLYKGPLSDISTSRLRIIRESQDGFEIAEKDLELRGFGDLLGTRQSGLEDYALSDLLHHSDLLAMARDDSKLLMERDEDLESDRGSHSRVLLYLFSRDDAVRLLRAG